MNWAFLIAALIAVESGGNPNAIGDNGDAAGILQIHESVISDYNRITGDRLSWPEDAFDASTAKTICRTYLSHYVTAKRLGRKPNVSDYIRCWNGGPRWFRKGPEVQKRLDQYERKVMDAMKEVSE